MTNINFYVSNQDGLEHRLNIAYKLIGHALKRQLFIHIHTDSEDMSKHIDNWLWTLDKPSFIPHRVISQTIDAADDEAESNLKTNKEEIAIKEKITISHNHEPLGKCDYLINLSVQLPSFFSRFTKLAEVLDNSDEILAAGRKRYVFYRDRGYTLAYHKL
ncbi:MAG TPA: DNA polymerase III subunit chi [Leucothrix sp.]|nr:DNA polymerase III subunit chi [Leucothrix sp.]